MTEKRAALLIVLDGAGDRRVDELGGETPFEAADTPHLDEIAAEGQTGLMNVIGYGQTPGSDTAHLSLFGYDPEHHYPGRGPLEALGAGLDSRPGDVAFRSNFATVTEDLIVEDRRAGRDISPEEGAVLQERIDGMVIEDVSVRFVHTTEHRGALVLRGPDLSADIGDVDPHETGKKILTCEAYSPEAEKTARIVNKFVSMSNRLLKDLELNKKRVERGMPPANIILLRGPGKHEDIPTIKKRYGIESAVIAGGALYIGTAKYVGMDHIKVKGQTGTIETNFDGIAEKTIECIESGYDYIFLHIKATDNASHDHNAAEKVLAIEKSDAMIGKILEKVGNRLVVLATADHCTPVSVGEHTCDPVPVALYADFIRPDDVKRLSEFDAAHGALGMLKGSDVMPLLLGYAGHIEKYGA
ncbi:2,3-bisphosphoglycerate-independent phosphoglycerate mutase [Candidatus Thorarchaeota archaeon]|nr:MAG: 2,3-bisphosphoglycerate-independent phosphoglycerate mutase [Candidatus Thorarchaeota archaeon]